MPKQVRRRAPPKSGHTDPLTPAAKTRHQSSYGSFPVLDTSVASLAQHTLGSCLLFVVVVVLSLCATYLFGREGYPGPSRTLYHPYPTSSVAHSRDSQERAAGLFTDEQGQPLKRSSATARVHRGEHRTSPALAGLIRSRCEADMEYTQRFQSWMPVYDPLQHEGQREGLGNLFLHPAVAAGSCETDVWRRFGLETQDHKFDAARNVRVRGLLATEDLEPGTELMKIPWRHMLTESSLGTDTIRATLARALKRYPVEESWNFGVLLAREMRLKDSDVGSPFKQYLDTLPTECPCIWCTSEVDLDKFIFGSPIGRKKEEYYRRVHDKLQERAEEIFRLPEVRELLRGGSYHDILWGTCMVASRTFMGEDESSHTFLMVPFLDFANHNDKGIYMAWDPNDRTANLVLQAPIRAGEQIYVNYGSKRSLEFIVAYGFIPIENDADVYDLTIQTSAKSKPELFQRALEEDLWNAREVNALQITVGLQYGQDIPTALLGFARSLHVPASYRLSVEEMTGEQPLGPKQEVAALKVILRFIDEGIPSSTVNATTGERDTLWSYANEMHRSMITSSFWEGQTIIQEANLIRILAKLRTQVESRLSMYEEVVARAG